MIRKVLSHQSKFGRGSVQEYEPLSNSRAQSSCESILQDNFSIQHYEQDIQQKMQNQLGLSNGSNFRIVNVGDGSVMELIGNKLMTRFRTEDPERINLQIFDCSSTESGHFEISCRHQRVESTKMVLDFFPHRGALIQKRKTKSARGNQNWSSETVPGKEATYFILKAPEGLLCLKNMGVEKQIMVVEKTAEAIANPLTHWKLESRA